MTQRLIELKLPTHSKQHYHAGSPPDPDVRPFIGGACNEVNINGNEGAGTMTGGSARESPEATYTRS